MSFENISVVLPKICSEKYAHKSIYYNRGERPSSYFWHDSLGHEVDCIIDNGIKLIPIEIKAGKTIDLSCFKGLDYWNELVQADPGDGYIIYGGKEKQGRSKGNIVSWVSTQRIIDKQTE